MNHARLGTLLTPIVLILSACSSTTTDPAEPAVSGPAAPVAPATAPAPDPPAPELIALGDTAFNEGFCVRCHRAGGVGSDRAPNLTDSTWIHSDGSFEGIKSTITSGVPKEMLSNPDLPFAMNGADMMGYDDETVAVLAAYVWSLSHTSD